MIKSINTNVDIIIDATSYLGLTDYGKIIVGDNGFEFYHSQNINKYIKIPWKEVDIVIASVLFNGKFIPRYAIKTKNSGIYKFSSKKPKKVLIAINKYVSSDRMVCSLGIFAIIKKQIFKQK